MPPTSVPAPDTAPRRSAAFELRLSTVLLCTALISLLVALPLGWYNDRPFRSSLDTLVAILLFGVFPISSLGGALAALVLLAWKRRWQFLLELLLGGALLLFLSRWEFP